MHHHSVFAISADPDDLMGQTASNEDGEFEVQGSETELSDIDPKLNIYHNCEDEQHVRVCGIVGMVSGSGNKQIGEMSLVAIHFAMQCICQPIYVDLFTGMFAQIRDHHPGQFHHQGRQTVRHIRCRNSEFVRTFPGRDQGLSESQINLLCFQLINNNFA